MYLFDPQLHSVIYKDRHKRYEKQQEYLRKVRKQH